MATPLLGLALPTTGSLTGTWGDTINNSITSLVDSAVAGTTTISTDADVTLTTTAEASNQAREAIILWSAAGTVTRYITAPAQSKTYVVINSSGTQSIVLRGAGPTTGITIAAGEKCVAAWNGTDFVKVATSSAAIGTVTSVGWTGGIVSVGTPTSTPAFTIAGTSGGVPYFSSSSTWVSSGALVSNALVVGGGAGAAPSTITTGTGVVTALGVNTGSAGAFVVNGGAGGTPSSIVLTNATSVPVNQATGALPVANGGTGATATTGSGSNVLSTSPTLVTPILGTPTSGNLSNCTFPTLNQNTTGTAAGLSSTLVVSSGGTGLTSTPANGALDIGNGSGFTRTTLTAGSNVTITNGAGSITIAASSGGGSAATPTALGTVYANTTSGSLFAAALGYQALRVATGTYNTAVGYNALTNAAAAGQNTAVGYNAGTAFTASSVGGNPGNHTLVGYLSGSAITTGYNNTFVGSAAGYAATTQNGSTALGTAAMLNTAANNSTCIGANTDVTGNNQVQLGDGSTTTYVYGTVQNRSDLRDKADVRDTQLGLGFINALRPVDYKWDMREDYKPAPPADLEDKNAMDAWREIAKLSNLTHDGSKKRSRFHHGLIAQEVKAVLDAQGIDFGGYQDHKVKDGQDVLTIGYDELIAPLIKAIQELTARVQELEAKA